MKHTNIIEGYKYSARCGAGLINLDWNEASEEVALSSKEMAEAILSMGSLHTYPEYFPASLRAATEEFYGISEEQILFCGGSDQAIELVLKAFSAKADSTHVMIHSYKHFEVFSHIFETSVKHYTADRLFEISDAEGIIYIVNPNNPTGEYYEVEKIERLVDRNPSAVILIDEAYIEFSGKESMVKKTSKYQNLIVTRTLSKAFGLASAKCGFLFANKKLLWLLEQYHNKKSTGVFSNIAAELALRNKERMMAYTQSVGEVKKRFYETLKSSKNSATNFECLTVKDPDAFCKLAEDYGFVFRDLSTSYGISATFRLTFPSMQHASHFLALTDQLIAQGNIVSVGVSNA
jgi:histidinol-phosphate/aromatic aminotransferase/cobyric acid decarboxylase-like protein